LKVFLKFRKSTGKKKNIEEGNERNMYLTNINGKIHMLILYLIVFELKEILIF